MPPYPADAIHVRAGSSRSRPVTVPPARPVEFPADADAVIRRVEHAYDGATRCVAYKMPSRVPRPFKRLADRKRAVELARQLSDLGASPEAWFLFSAEQWAVYNKGAMPLAYALSEKRFTERHGWFASEAGGYACRYEVLTETELAMNERYKAMQLGLRQAMPRSEAEVRAVCERYFPPGSMRALAERARQEIRQQQAAVDRMVAEGRWLWTRSVKKAAGGRRRRG
jgi:hypothetical protein